MRQILMFVSGLVVVLLVLFVIGETAQVVNLAATIHPTFGRVVLILLLLTYGVCAGVPVVLFLRLPKPLNPPPAHDGDEFRQYLARLARRLSRNSHLAGMHVSAADRSSVESALEVLHAQARERIASAAFNVFVATAVSQSGRLDGLMVLVAQTRMIWQVACVYWQRPSIREMMQLYSNVAATAFAAQAVEDLDLSEHLEDTLAPVLAGSAAAAIPGFMVVARVITDAVLEGTVNAFLTLRVGCIASQYCRSLTSPDRRLLRRSATTEAGRMLSGIALKGAATVSKAVSEGALHIGREKAAEMGRIVVKGAGSVSAAVSDVAERSGATELASQLSGLAVRAAEKTAAVITDAAKKGVTINPFRKKDAKTVDTSGGQKAEDYPEDRPGT